MSKLDELKERLGILKFWLGVIVGVFTAVFGWIVTTYKTQDTILLIIATIFLLGLLIAFFKLNQNIEKKLKESPNAPSFTKKRFRLYPDVRCFINQAICNSHDYV